MANLLIVGTDKGAFLLRSDSRRAQWTVEGPLFKGWRVTAATRDAQGRTFLGVNSTVYGPAIQVSDDLKSWRQVSGPAYPKDGRRKLTQIWKIFQANGVHYCGVAEAGLFRSEDRGESWQPVPGLNEHETAAAWVPGAGGLCAHAILHDRTNPQRMWCGISAVGVFRTDDGGRTWHPKNKGVTVVLEDKIYKDVGYCVHGLAQDPDNPSLIWRQDHRGMYRTRDGGDTWEKIERGLPSGFGFPIALHAKSRALYALPLESDEFRMPPEGKLRVYRSTNGGDAWEPLTKGLPQGNSYDVVLRHALTVDTFDPAGVYFGTTAGALYGSRDAGESWHTLPLVAPRIVCLAIAVE
jgi:photosystem II stability/assembly factor-like uncharacterized protein